MTIPRRPLPLSPLPDRPAAGEPRHRAAPGPKRPRPQPARHRAAGWRLAPFGLAAVLIAAVAVPIVEDSSSAQASAKIVRLAYDPMSRTVASGLGQAEVGGAYSVRSTSTTAHESVGNGRATLSGITPGSFSEAWLGAVSSTNVEARVQFTVPAIPTAGTGLYLATDLRRQANGDSYRSRIRVAPGGKMFVGFTRVRGDVEVNIGKEIALPNRLTPGATVVLDGAATGQTRVILSVRAYALSATQPVAWQHRVSDAAAQRISTAGATGLWSYASGHAQSTSSVLADEFEAYELSGTADDSPLPPPTVTTSASATTSTSPSRTTTSPAPTTSHPSTPVPTTKAPSTTATPTKTSPKPTPTTTTTTPPPVTPPPAGAAGAAAPGTTSYAVPAGALFVAPGGSDSAKGTSAAPVRTVAKAVALAKSGSTIVLRGGTYHESITVPSDRSVTIQAYPKETVWFDGSTAVSGWTKSGNTWIHDGWTATFDHSPSFSTGGNSGFVNSSYPMAAHPDQLWINGQPQQQVSSAGAVVAGTFFVDYSAHRLIVGSNPSSVRASDLAQAIQVNSANTVLRGFGVHNYATPAPDLGTVLLAGKSEVAENLVVESNATVGLTVAATKTAVRHVTVRNNGLLGLLANYADGLVVDGLLSQGNNAEHFNTAPTAAGMKITRSRGVVIKNSTFTGNHTTGLWVDESSYDVTVTGNHIYNNDKHGFSWEIGAKGVIADNVITGNTSDGMKINDVTHVRIWNNTVTGNGLEIILVQDARRASDTKHVGHDPRQPLPDPTVTWLLGDIELHNNVLDPPSGSSTTLYATDGSGQRSAAQMDVRVDNNLFAPVSAGALVVWGGSGGKSTVCKTLTQFKATTGTGKSNGETMSTTVATPLPSDIAALIGQAGGTKHLGAF